MSILYGGGLWSIGILMALAFGYARVFDAGRRGYYFIAFLATVVTVFSQLLPRTHPFYQSTNDDLWVLFWCGMIAIPVGIYTLFIRWARRKVEARNDT
ncbi:MAG: hypothetical protein JKY31_06445 [Rhodobacteraceae bacterium]|nr:hypothetical protein [Paracoccaceae bacterium]